MRWRIRDGHPRRARPRRRLPGDRRPALPGRRRPATSSVHVEVEVANFYPALATWVGALVLHDTQSRIHVLVTHGFLRSLARLELEESAVGRFAEDGDGDAGPRAGEPPVNVGDTPWLAWAGIAAGDRRWSPRSLYLRFGCAGAALAVAVAGQRAQLVAVVARLDRAARCPSGCA